MFIVVLYIVFDSVRKLLNTPSYASFSLHLFPEKLLLGSDEVFVFLYKVAPYLTKYHIMKTYCGSRCIAPRILNLGTGGKWVVRFTPWPLYPRGKIPLYVLDRRLGEPQDRYGHGGEEKKSYHCTCRELNPCRPEQLLGIREVSNPSATVSGEQWSSLSWA
jgi:hypothetical protein